MLDLPGDQLCESLLCLFDGEHLVLLVHLVALNEALDAHHLHVLHAQRLHWFARVMRACGCIWTLLGEMVLTRNIISLLIIFC